jgi:uncharacterized protein YkwD
MDRGILFETMRYRAAHFSFGLLTVLSVLAFPLVVQSQQVKPSSDPHPVFIVLDDEPAVDHPEAFWIGYPTKKWQALERSVEEHVGKVRAADGKGAVESLEELRFIGRAHARENVATKTSNGHLSKYSGYVSDRAGTLYGWLPTEWIRPGEAFRSGYRVADNGGATREMTGEGWVEKGWMTSPPHREAILDPGLRFVGMGLGGTKDFTVAHLVFAAMPKETYERIQNLQPLYQQLAKAKKAEVKGFLESIVEKGEGSSFIRIAPLLRDPEREVRLAAVEALKKLHEKVPQAKGPIFALVEYGVLGQAPETALESAKALKTLTGETHTTAKAWSEWWWANWKTYRSPVLVAAEPKAPPMPARVVREPELTRKLGILENWKSEKGQWTPERAAAVPQKGAGNARSPEIDGFRGAGDSALRFKDAFPKDFRLEFTLNVVDGMRPRIHFEGCNLFFGNEGFEKHFFVYGDGARNVQGGRIPYSNGHPVVIRVDMWDDDFTFWVDGKLCATGKRTVPPNGTQLMLRGGDDWSQGTCVFSKFSISSKAP